MDLLTDTQALTPVFEGPRIARKVVPFVIENFAEEIALEDLAREAGMSRFSFCRRFHKECGLPPMRWLWNFRTILASEFIKLDPHWSLTDVAFACGFTSSAHFSRTFKALFGVSPSKFRKDVLNLNIPDHGGTGFPSPDTAVVLGAARAAMAGR